MSVKVMTAVIQSCGGKVKWRDKDYCIVMNHCSN